jgi:hypothetical protein
MTQSPESSIKAFLKFIPKIAEMNGLGKINYNGTFLLSAPIKLNVKYTIFL